MLQGIILLLLFIDSYKTVYEALNYKVNWYMYIMSQVKN